MASKFMMFSFFILLVFFFSASSNADTPPPPATTTPITPELACNATLYPDFCKSLLPRSSPHDIYDYGRFSIRQSLSSTRKFSTLIDAYLVGISPTYLTPVTTLSQNVIRALKDCRLLAELNMDFLSNIINTIGSTTDLPSLKADDMETLLSAVITNQKTCLDGLQETNSPGIVRNSLYSPLSDGNKMSSVSLALYNRGWVHKRMRGKMEKGRKFLCSDMKSCRHGRLPLKMSSRNREIFDWIGRRKLHQTSSDDQVLVRDIVIVSKDGGGNFTTINDAVAAAPNNTVVSDGYFLIYVVSGVYEEYVTIDKKKKNILMMGDGINQTVITGNRNVVDGWTTFNSATFVVLGQGFVAVNITFRNTAGAIKHQAVAVRNGADLSTFYSCSFEAYQDTLYTHSLRQFYRECHIYGTVDFIFGNAAVVFQNCNLYARLPMPGQFNALTAQGRTDPNQNTGTSIQNCNILAAPDLASSNGTTKTYLGRPWKEYSRTVYMQSYIGILIPPEGWVAWSADFALNTSYYAEFNNRGPGSDTTKRVKWPGYHVIGASNATTFTVSNFISGGDWLSSTGVPYDAGLL